MGISYAWERSLFGGGMYLGNHFGASIEFAGRYPVTRSRFSVWSCLAYGDRVSVEIAGDAEHEIYIFSGSEGEKEASKVFLRNLDRLRSMEGLEGIGAENMLELHDSLDVLEQRLKEIPRTKIGRVILKGWRRGVEVGRIVRSRLKNPNHQKRNYQKGQ